MKKKKINAKVGDLFVVPIIQGGYGLGLVAIKNKTIILGYFFKRLYSSVPDKVDTTDINKWEIALIGKFSSMGIENGEWPIIQTMPNYNKNEWPIPVLKMQESLSQKHFAVVYDDTLVNEERYLISEEEAKELFNHGLHGYGVLEKKLSSILAEASL